jgi:hypothetical protein
MSLAQAERTVPGTRAGGVRLVPLPHHDDVCAELVANRYVVADIPDVPRGMLRRTIDRAVEEALSGCGALPPAVDQDAGIDAKLKDQAFRVRALGANGLAILLPSLAEDDDARLLDADDSAALSTWVAATTRVPVVLVLADSNRALRLLLPVRLVDLLGMHAPRAGDLLMPVVSADIATQAPPPVLMMPRQRPTKKPPGVAATVSWPDGQVTASTLPDVPQPGHDPTSQADQEGSPRDVALAGLGIGPSFRAVDGAAAQRVVSAATWRAHALELDKAHGPKPVSVIDRLFCTRYVPLLGAIARGDADQTVKNVVDTWRTNFEHSYREAFSTLRVTGKRPPMVFDVPDLAARVARLNGARATKLLLVDGMRFDLGEHVAERLQERLAGHAVCIEKVLLWAALPTSTPAQMALLARGPEGLREPEAVAQQEGDVVRDRAVSTVRRERVGSREVMKLDVVEARLRMAGPAFDERLDALAEEVASIAAKFAESLPPRTLLFLFGDHGFRLPVNADGLTTGPATQGGCSPEEVLVPGQAWLVGGTH